MVLLKGRGSYQELLVDQLGPKLLDQFLVVDGLDGAILVDL